MTKGKTRSDKADADKSSGSVQDVKSRYEMELLEEGTF